MLPAPSALQSKSKALAGEPARSRGLKVEEADPASRPTPAASAGPGGQVRIQAEGYTADGRRKAKERKKGKKRQRVDQSAVQENIQRVMAEIKGGGRKRRRRGSQPSREEQELAELEAEEEREREA